MRLIDADALKREFETTPYNDYDDLLRTERLIDDAPTVPERQKGEWIKYDNGFIACPFCKFDTKHGRWWKFCPNCGADMRGNSNG